MLVFITYRCCCPVKALVKLNSFQEFSIEIKNICNSATKDWNCSSRHLRLAYKAFLEQLKINLIFRHMGQYMLWYVVLIPNQLCSYTYFILHIKPLGFLIHTQIFNWWGKRWHMVTYPFRALVVLYQMFTFIMCLIWLILSTLFIHSFYTVLYTSLSCFCPWKFFLCNERDNIRFAYFISDYIRNSR